MAERRMFAKTIIDSDAFLDMPLSTQSLYFHLSMRADDDGFINNPKKIQRMIGCNDDDLKLLAAKRFIIPFESGVCVIKHWRIHNYIQKDRYKETVYKDEKSQLQLKENNAYTLSETPCIQDGHSSETQVRLGKVRLGKVSIGEERLGECEGEIIDAGDPPDAERPTTAPVPYEQIKSLFNSICISLSKCTTISDARRKAIKARISSGYTVEDFKRLFEKAEASSFLKGKNAKNWRATFDWLICDANMAKTLDGNYDDYSQDSQAAQSTGNVFLDMLRDEEMKNEQS